MMYVLVVLCPLYNGVCDGVHHLSHGTGVTLVVVVDTNTK